MGVDPPERSCNTITTGTISARTTSGRLEFAVAYPYGKSLDQPSNIGEEVNPFTPALSYELSSFDVLDCPMFCTSG